MKEAQRLKHPTPQSEAWMYVGTTTKKTLGCRQVKNGEQQPYYYYWGVVTATTKERER